VEGTDQDKAECARGMLECEAPHSVGRAGRADEHGSVDFECVHERGDVGHQVRRSISGRRALGVPVAALAGGEGVEPVRQVFQNPLERAPRVEVGVQQHDRHAGAVPLLDVLQGHAGGKAGRP
jgi:hypothetical protein